ncbi:GNAT family N-acetyltransferase [Gephyromycinifex aptenodytis]|uniref:GNAT family N-acetyltransferase n=1 Tax=Gephyromycinifex aptenodytis TaxID=2716227 RepID=UPI001446C65F|nr:GNAT family N-acetyltransferase [Gephyromycinifex aptenodytis]
MIPAPDPEADRLSVRRAVPDGLRDVVGVVLSQDEEALTLLPEAGGPVRIPRAHITASRVAPPRAVRPSSSPADLHRVMAGHLPAPERMRLGGWLLQAAHGWSWEANAALVVGDPGTDPRIALASVEDFYRRRGLTPRVQVPLRAASADSHRARPDGDASALVPLLDELGWTSLASTNVLVADLRASRSGGEPRSEATASAETVIGWAREPDADWYSLWLAGRAPAAAREEIRTGPAYYLTLRQAAAPVAIGRLALSRGWAGLSQISVTPRLRRRGLGRQASAQMLAQAASLGARFAVVQVPETDSAALGLGAAAGFTLHHQVHYRCLAR